MRYAKPEFSVQDVNKARNQLVSSSNTAELENLKAMDVIDNWRASHAYPAKSFYVTLKKHACKVSPKALVAQRIKRLPSIVAKLAREESMRLSQMQDIAGCRAVVSNVEQVGKLR